MATMLPVLTAVTRTLGVEPYLLYFGLLTGATLGGNLTPIGASANVAGTSIAARAGHSISWGRYCKYSAPATVIIIAVSMAMLLMRV